MIGYFPEPYPDELFYSICARYNDRMGFREKSAAARSLFGVNKLAGLVHWPHRLSYFLHHLPSNHNYIIDRIIQCHTSLPYFRPFIPLERIEDIQKRMCSNEFQRLHTAIGAINSSISLPQYLQYCEKCAEEDIASFGEPYWHRVHQLSGIVICTIHHIPLVMSNIGTKKTMTYGIFSLKSFLSSPRTVELIRFPKEHEVTLINIAQNTKWLLARDNLFYDSDKINGQYAMLLGREGYASYHGEVSIAKLIKALKYRYSNEILDLIGCPIDPHMGSWISGRFKLGQRRVWRNMSPLNHLLMMDFLNLTAAQFFSSNPEKHPSSEIKILLEMNSIQLTSTTSRPVPTKREIVIDSFMQELLEEYSPSNLKVRRRNFKEAARLKQTGDSDSFR